MKVGDIVKIRDNGWGEISYVGLTTVLARLIDKPREVDITGKIEELLNDGSPEALNELSNQKL